MAAATISNTAAVFKEIWEPGAEAQWYPHAGAAWALCPKQEDWDGIYRNVVANTGGMSGVSSTFANAKAAQNPSGSSKFKVETVDRFVLWSVDHKAMHLSRNDRGAVVELVAQQTSDAMERLMLTQAEQIHNGTGQAIGRIAAIAGSTFTLENFDKIKNFEENDLLYLSANDGNASTDVLKAGGPLTVTTADPDTGIVTCTAGIVATIATAAVGDYIFRAGDFQLGASGFEAWNPLVVPATAFWGVVRNTGQVGRKAGIRSSVAAVVGAVNKIKRCLTHAYRAGSQFTHMFVDPLFYASLEAELGDKVRFVDRPAIAADGGETTIGFTGIKFTQHGGSPVEIFPDAYAPLNVARGVNYGPKGFRWVSAGKFPMWLTSDGKADMMTLEGSNAAEGRAGGYGNYMTKRPLDLGRFQLA